MASELVSWGAPVEPKGRPKLEKFFPPVEVLLDDGGLLVVDVSLSQGKNLLAESLALGDLEIPLSRVRAMLFSPPGEGQRRDALANRLLEPGKTDRLVLLNGDVVPGKVIRFMVAEDRAKQWVEIDVTDVGVTRIDAGRIAGVAFHRATAERPDAEAAQAWVGFSDGTRLVAQSLRVSADEVRVGLSGGIVWTAESLDDLVFLQPLADRLTYVSDLLAPTSLDDSGDARGTDVGHPNKKRARYKFVPYLTVSWPYHADRNVRGTHLRSAGRPYLKGIGMHSGGALTLVLPGRYRRFEADLALDDYVGTRGSVVFAVKVIGRKDGTIGIVREATSKIICGGQSAVPISADLTGALGIQLEVLYSQRGDELDHANWLNARLVK